MRRLCPCILNPHYQITIPYWSPHFIPDRFLFLHISLWRKTQPSPCQKPPLPIYRGSSTPLLLSSHSFLTMHCCHHVIFSFTNIFLEVIIQFFYGDDFKICNFHLSVKINLLINMIYRILVFYLCEFQNVYCLLPNAPLRSVVCWHEIF